MLTKMLNGIEKIDVSSAGFFNPVTEVASRLGTIKDPILGSQIVQLIAILDKKNRDSYESRKKEKDEDDE